MKNQQPQAEQINEEAKSLINWLEQNLEGFSIPFHVDSNGQTSDFYKALVIWKEANKATAVREAIHAYTTFIAAAVKSPLSKDFYINGSIAGEPESLPIKEWGKLAQAQVFGLEKLFIHILDHPETLGKEESQPFEPTTWDRLKKAREIAVANNETQIVIAIDEIRAGVVPKQNKMDRIHELMQEVKDGE